MGSKSLLVSDSAPPNLKPMLKLKLKLNPFTTFVTPKPRPVHSCPTSDRGSLDKFAYGAFERKLARHEQETRNQIFNNLDLGERRAYREIVIEMQTASRTNGAPDCWRKCEVERVRNVGKRLLAHFMTITGSSDALRPRTVQNVVLSLCDSHAKYVSSCWRDLEG